MNNFAPHLKLEVGSALAAGSVAAADRWNDLLKTIVKLCVHFCVCVSKSLRKWTQTDTKVTFHPPPPPTRKLFLVSNERYGKNKTFLLR